MRITDVKIEKLRLDLIEPFKVTFAEFTGSDNVIVKIETDAGICGYGEGAPLAFVTGEVFEGTIAVLKMFRQGLIGMDPLNIPGIHGMMDALIHENGSAKCAVDIALHDIKGKYLNLPVWKMLGGESGVVVNDVTIGITTPDKMAEAARRNVRELGFSILKVKCGIDPDTDIETMRLIREAVGPVIRLRVDANQGYTVEKALYAIEGFKKHGVDAVEQCLPDWDMEGSALIRSRVSGIKIILDESIHTPRDAERAIRLQAADVFNIKLMKCGGLYPGMRIGSLAGAGGLNCMVGCMLESSLAITAGISLVAANKAVTEADCDAFLFIKEPKVQMSGGFTRDGGTFTLLDKPGLGLDIGF
jgi:L-Ala-D/L-Glu epimerase